jgi:hypothetical protein
LFGSLVFILPTTKGCLIGVVCSAGMMLPEGLGQLEDRLSLTEVRDATLDNACRAIQDDSVVRVQEDALKSVSSFVTNTR